MLLILAFFTLLVVVATVLPFSRHQHWIIRAMDFPRLQIALFAAALLVAYFLILDIQMATTKVLVCATSLCLFWQLGWILPYTILWPVEVKACSDEHVENQLSVLTSNVLTPNRNAKALVALVKKHRPDVLVTLESDQWWQNNLAVLESEMPYTIKCPMDNLYGMHVYSKLPLSDQEICYLVEKDVPSMHALLELRTGDKVQLHFVHPAPPSPTENAESEERDAELVIVAQRIADSDMPVVVTGDLNDVAWSTTTRLFRKISGLLDPRIGRGMFNTFHVDYPFLRWPLDHLFHSAHFTLQGIQRLPSIGSDHFPLLTRLSYTPLRDDEQEGINADASDHERAKSLSGESDADKSDVPQPSASNKVS